MEVSDMGSDMLRLVTGISTLGMSEMMYYGPKDQQKAQKAAADAQQASDMNARRLVASQKPLEESATLSMNTGVADSALGALGLIVNPDLAKRKKPQVGLGSTQGSTGLGATVTNSLGFGG